jgi:DedD protein
VPATAQSSAAADTFAQDANGLPVAWVVQVGSFSSRANAEKMTKELQSKGYKAFIVTAGTGVGAARVYVGPKLSRERAEAQKNALDAALKIKAMVVRFPPA